MLDAAREAIADCLGTRPDEIAFCASGSHAAQLAIDGVRDARTAVGAIAVHSAIEHSSVLRAAHRGPSRPVAVDRLGHVDMDALATAVAEPAVAVAAVQSANHEVGTRQPIAAVAAACDAADVPLYVDAAQTVPWEPLPAGWSLASASAVKWGGPAGVGVLAVRKGTRWARPWPIDRTDPWTVTLPLVVAAAAALRSVRAGAAAESARLSGLVDRIRVDVAATVPDVEVVGDPVDRVPNIVTFSCLYADGEALLHALDRQRLCRLVRLGLYGIHPPAVTRAGGDGRADPRQHPRVTAPGRARRRRDAFPGRTPEGGGGSARRGWSDRSVNDHDAAGSTRIDVLDCRGQRCPLPIIELARTLPTLSIGTVLRVLADDPAAAVDIPAWCRMRGQDYVGSPAANAYDVRRLS